MIIGINGRIGHGKDTVGRIIQYLTLPGERGPYIGVQTYDDATLERNSPFKIKKFAGKLKQIGSILTGVPVEMFEDQEFKKSYLGEHWAKTPVAPLSDATLFDAVDLNNLMTYREFLQKLGTEAMRDGLHTNVWVNALMADYKYTKEFYDEQGRQLRMKGLPDWIITDMRFPNEMEAVVERKGITIRVVRPETKDYFQLKNRDGSITHATLHPSETSLDSAEFDYTIVNDSTIEDLVKKVKEILEKEGII